LLLQDNKRKKVLKNVLIPINLAMNNSGGFQFIWNWVFCQMRSLSMDPFTLLILVCWQSSDIPGLSCAYICD